MTTLDARFHAAALEAAAQWGMFTTSQAHAAGLTTTELAALTQRGSIVDVNYDVHRVVGTPDDITLDELRAAWLATTGEHPAWTPYSDPVIVVSHLSAAHTVHNLGTLRSPTLHLTAPTTTRAPAPDIEVHCATIAPGEWTIIDGLPVTTISRTIADVYLDHIDGGHLGDILRDALELAAEPATFIIEALDTATDGRGRDLVKDCLNQNGTPPYVLAGNELLTQHRRQREVTPVGIDGWSLSTDNINLGSEQIQPHPLN